MTAQIFPPKKEKLVYPKINKLDRKYIYIYIKDIDDKRDIYYKNIFINELPKIVDLRYNSPDIYNQGKLDSCTANALAFLFEFNEKNNKNFKPSRLFIYYNEKNFNHKTDYNSGASIRDTIKVICKTGLCDEKLWNYDINKSKLKPPVLCYTKAKKYKTIKYYKLEQDIYNLKSCLEEGFPFIVAISIYESFDTKNTIHSGIVKIPENNEVLLGSHTVVVVGYDDNYGFIVSNSFGTYWGINGYCFIPYNYICNKDLAYDLWTIRTIDF